MKSNVARSSKATSKAPAHTTPAYDQRGYDRLRNHHSQLQFARWQVAELERLWPISASAEYIEPDPWADGAAADAWALDTMLNLADWRLMIVGANVTAPMRVEAVRDALELARRGASADPAVVRDAAINVAINLAPDLHKISVAEWKRAIAAWPGIKRGGSRSKGVTGKGWADVVFALLKPHGLTNADSAAALRETFAGAPRRRSRASRAK